MEEVKITNMVKFYTVLLLLEGPKTGYEIIKETGAKMEKNTSPGQIYPFLKTLEEHGYIDASEPAAREKVEYKLTASGKKFVNNMISRFGEIIKIAIEPSLSTCAHCGCKVYEGGHKEDINGKHYVFCCCHCAKAFKDGRYE